MMFARMTLALVLTAGLSSIARAEYIRCPASAAPAALSLEQAVGKAEALGYAVKEAKRKRSCWKIEGFDRNGAEIEIYFDAGSGAVIKSRYWRAPVQRRRRSCLHASSIKCCRRVWYAG